MSDERDDLLSERVSRLRTSKEQGIYRVWSQDRTLVYVGSTLDLERRRGEHNLAITLGGQMEILERCLDLTRKELRSKEDQWILELRRQGLSVVNPTNEEWYREHGKVITEAGLEAKRRWAMAGVAAMLAAKREKREERNRKARLTQLAKAAEQLNGQHNGK